MANFGLNLYKASIEVDETTSQHKSDNDTFLTNQTVRTRNRSSLLIVTLKCFRFTLLGNLSPF